jgi:hypothetical protein
MNDDRHNDRQQCPARPDDGGHALAFVVGRGCRKSGRSVSPRYQPDNLRLIGNEGEQSNHRFRTFSSAPTRRLPGIGC